ncbi:hypothetical protein M0I35_RS08530 [Providencia rettgeri]|nr:hypothetical protein [Providencia rettgeri]
MNDKYMERISNYLDKDNIDYSLLINGAWGSGKTHLMREFINKNNNYKFIYIDLYCIFDVEMLQAHILFKSMKKKEGKYRDKITESLPEVTNFAKRIPFLKNMPIDEIIGIFNDRTLLNENLVLVLDNLERSNLDADKVLGYVNSIIEIKNVKVILIANELEIKNLESYSKIKEKTIGKTVLIKKNTTQALKEIVNANNLSDYFDMISLAYSNVEIENLRVVNRVLEQLRVELSEITKIDDFSESIHDFILIYFGYGVIFGSSDVTFEKHEETLKKFHSSFNKRIEMGTLYTSWYDYFINEDMEMLMNDIITPELSRVNENKRMNSLTEEKKKMFYWKKTYDMLLYDNDEGFLADINKICDDVKNFNFRTIDSTDKFHSLICKIDLVFKYRDLINSSSKIINGLQTMVGSLTEQDKMPLVELIESQSYKYSPLGYTFESKDDEVFNKILKSLFNNYKKTNGEYKSSYEKFLEILSKDNWLDKISKMKEGDVSFPIVEGMDPKPFCDFLIGKNGKEMNDTISLFLSKYATNHYYNNIRLDVYHKSDLEYLNKLVNSLENEKNRFSDTIIKKNAIKNTVDALYNVVNRMKNLE